MNGVNAKYSRDVLLQSNDERLFERRCYRNTLNKRIQLPKIYPMFINHPNFQANFRSIIRVESSTHHHYPKSNVASSGTWRTSQTSTITSPLLVVHTILTNDLAHIHLQL